MAKSKRNIDYTQSFFVKNLSGYCLQTEELMTAELVIGAHGISEDGFPEPHLTCHLVAETEIDYEINELQKQLEAIRKKAKAMLAKHQADEEVLMGKKGAINSARKKSRPPVSG